MKKRSSILARVGIVALVLTLVTSTMTSGTLAKYVTNEAGTITALVARWNADAAINYVDSTEGQKTVSVDTLAMSLDKLVTTPNTKTAAGTIAPGMSGSFDIVVSALGENGDKVTDTDITYDIYMFEDSANAARTPVNLTVEATTNAVADAEIDSISNTTYQSYVAGTAVPSGNGGRIATGTVLRNNVQTPETADKVTIEWSWDYETGANSSAIVEGNKNDTTAGLNADGLNNIKYYIVVLMSQADPNATTTG